MSLLKKLAGLAVGAAAVGAAVYVLQNREHHDDEYEHIWGSEDEVEPETDFSPSPLTMRPLWLNPPPPPHLKNLPSPLRRKSPRNPRKLKRPPPRRLPTTTPPT